METPTTEIGKNGEYQAAQFLKDNGYTICEQNWKLGKYEIDIIAQKEDTLVFVEVKTRNGFEIPADRIVLSQQKQRIMKSAHAYILRYNILLEPRFDLITIFGSGPQMRISHIESYFYPTLLSARSL
jgi:putative endonuclease